VKTGRGAVIAAVSPLGDLRVVASSVSKKRTDGGKAVRMKLMPNVYPVQVFSLKTMTSKNRFDVKTVYSGRKLLVRTIRKGLREWQMYEMTDTCLLWSINVTKNLIL
jgi:hypothetical protein